MSPCDACVPSSLQHRSLPEFRVYRVTALQLLFLAVSVRQDKFYLQHESRVEPHLYLVCPISEWSGGAGDGRSSEGFRVPAYNLSITRRGREHFSGTETSGAVKGLSQDCGNGINRALLLLNFLEE